MDNIKLFTNLTEAREQGLEGLSSPHVDVVRGFRVVNYHKAGKSSFKCRFDDQAHIKFYDGYVCFSAASEQTVSMTVATSPNLKYSFDKEVWKDWDYSALTFGTSEHPCVYIIGDNETFSTATNKYNTFVFGNNTAKVSVSGNIMALLNGVDLASASLTDFCFFKLFDGAEAIESVSEDFLPATTLASGCYYFMFRGCNSLTTLPENLLPATALTSTCYLGMFMNCTGLTTLPENLLPATTLADGCYYGMFWNCTSLKDSPALPARTLVDNCYYKMFNGCTALTSITVSAKSTTAVSCTTQWVTNVASSGTFYGKASAGWVDNSVDGIPSGWTNTWRFVSFTTTGASQTVLFSGYTCLEKNLQYSYDNKTWNTYNYTTLTFGTGSSRPTIYFRGNNPSGICGDGIDYMNMFMFGDSATKVDLGGNIMGLIAYSADTKTIPNSGCFYFLFRVCKAIEKIDDDFLPATALTVSCYKCLFENCTSLTISPELPATVLMESCYQGMFGNCASLTTAPVLPATTLAEYCYKSMFASCSSLNEIHCDATDISADMCTYTWVNGVSSTGDFYGKSAAGWSTGTGGIPSGWTQHLE